MWDQTSASRLGVMSLESEHQCKGRPHGQECQTPQERAGARLSPPPCQAPSVLWEPTARPGTPLLGTRPLGRGGPGPCSSFVPAPLTEGWWRWAPGTATGCIPAGTVVGLVGNHNQMSMRNSWGRLAFPWTSPAGEGRAITRGG